MDRIYEKQGLIYNKVFHALFKRESDLITYVTVARNTWKYHQTTINARILTFYDYGIAYILNMDVIDTICSYPYSTKIEKGSFNNHSYFCDILKPRGINELRFIDGPLCLEVFLIMYKTLENIKKKYPILKIMNNLDLPLDILELIYNINDVDITNIINSEFEISTCKPFKVQGLRHGSKRPVYKVVLLNTTYQDDENNTWYDMNEIPYEDSDDDDDDDDQNI